MILVVGYCSVLISIRSDNPGGLRNDISKAICTTHAAQTVLFVATAGLDDVL
jgi:hypothetical protein